MTSTRIDFVGLLRAVRIGADDPQSGPLEQAERARQVRHRDHRRGLGGACRHLARGCVQWRGPIARHDHGEHAAGIRRAQAGAQIVWILHAVERQQQRLGGRRQRRHFGHDPLMHRLTEPRVQLPGVDALYRATRGMRQPFDLVGLGIMAAVLQPHARHSFRVSRQQRPHRVQAVDDFSPLRAQDR
jgi:hypothetical protein